MGFFNFALAVSFSDLVMFLCTGHSDLRNMRQLEDLTPGVLLEQGLNDLGYFSLDNSHYI